MIPQRAAIGQRSAGGGRARVASWRGERMDGGDAQGPWRGVIAEGEWAGWSQWGNDPFEMHAGPFFRRLREDGSIVCAFKAEKKHMNGSGFMHGGCLMTFADF